MVRQINKGILLAGGTGSRLHPSTRVNSKQLLPVYDKPLIYYPLGTLMELGIRDVLLITRAEDVARFTELLGDGSQLGINIEYRTEDHPHGIAHAFIIAEDFVDSDNVALVLGDNIFCDVDDLRRGADEYGGGATIFALPVDEPTQYGVAEVDAGGRVLSIEEKPTNPKSDLAITGLYLFDSDVTKIARSLEPSDRGELEISDVNQAYLDKGRLALISLAESAVWFDAGTSSSMLSAGNYIASVERISGRKIGCIEEIAYRRGLINRDQIEKLAAAMPESDYRQYLERLFSV